MTEDYPLAAWFRVQTGPNRGDAIRIARPTSRIGSAIDCEVHIADPDAPAVACVIELVAGEDAMLRFVDGRGVSLNNLPAERFGGGREMLCFHELLVIGRVGLIYMPLDKSMLPDGCTASFPAGCELAATRARVPLPPGSIVVACLVALDGDRAGWDVPLIARHHEGLIVSGDLMPGVELIELRRHRFEYDRDECLLTATGEGQSVTIDEGQVVELSGVRWTARFFW